MVSDYWTRDDLLHFACERRQIYATFCEIEWEMGVEKGRFFDGSSRFQKKFFNLLRIFKSGSNQRDYKSPVIRDWWLE